MHHVTTVTVLAGYNVASQVVDLNLVLRPGLATYHAPPSKATNREPEIWNCTSFVLEERRSKIASKSELVLILI